MSERKRVRIKIPDPVARRSELRRKRRKRRLKRAVAGGLILSVLAGSYAAWYYQTELINSLKPKPAEVWYEARAKNIEVSLPKDDAPHDYNSERWSYSGELITADGHRYSFHYETFLLNSMVPHTVTHAALADHQSGQHYTDSYKTAGNPSLGTRNKFYFPQLHALMSGSGGQDKLELNTESFSFKLDAYSLGIDAETALLHDQSGKLNLLEAGELYYYSRPRMTVKGFIQIGSNEYAVNGQAWFDHSWSAMRLIDFRWRWFSFNLDDGTDLMVYQLYDGAGLPISGFASLRTADSSQAITVYDEDFIIKTESAQTWQGAGYSYSLTWSVQLPDYGIDLTTTPVVPGSEFNGQNTAGFSYWKGPIRVEGSHRGRGFMEIRTPRAQAKKKNEAITAFE